MLVDVALDVSENVLDGGLRRDDVSLSVRELTNEAEVKQTTILV